MAHRAHRTKSNDNDSGTSGRHGGVRSRRGEPPPSLPFTYASYRMDLRRNQGAASRGAALAAAGSFRPIMEMAVGAQGFTLGLRGFRSPVDLGIVHHSRVLAGRSSPPHPSPSAVKVAVNRQRPLVGEFRPGHTRMVAYRRCRSALFNSRVAAVKPQAPRRAGSHRF